jgi:hypothetical protein
MNSMYQLLALVGAGLIGWILYRTVKNKPEQFSRENMMKSFSSMGFLALILIAFVAFLVILTRQ